MADSSVKDLTEKTNPQNGDDFLIEDNTANETKRIRYSSLKTALEADLTGKQNTLGFTPENVANKSVNLTSPDDTKYPTTLAVSTALGGKQDSLGFTAENVANKENTTINTDTTKYPTVNLLKTGLDLKSNLADVLTKTNTTPYTPTQDYHPATRKWVLDLAVEGNEYFVSTTGNDANDGLSWATPFLTLAAAINSAGDGDLITIAPGTYTITTEIIVDKAVRIFGLEGRNNTILESDGLPHRILDMVSGGCVVGGLTIRGGITADTSGIGEGGNVKIRNFALLEDCIVENGSGYQYGGNIIIDDGAEGGGRVSRCIIRGGVTRFATGGGGGIALLGPGFIEYCLIYDNTSPTGGGIATGTGSFGSIVRNCTIVENTATGWNVGVVVYGGGWVGQQQSALENNIIRTNSPNDAAFIQYASGAKFKHNNIDVEQLVFGVGPSGPGNVNVNPLFIDPSSENWRLQKTSPMREAGTFSYNREFGRTIIDIDYNLVEQGSIPDIGCYGYIKPKAQREQIEVISGFIETVADKDYRISLSLPYSGEVLNTKTISESGTCTATFKIGSTALGGTANSVSSSLDSEDHSTDNEFDVGDSLVLTASSNSTCLGLAYTITVRRILD